PDGGEREWRSQLVPRYRRSSPEVEQSVLGVYLSGSNTRRIRGALEPLLSGGALSKGAIWRKRRSCICTWMRSIRRCAAREEWCRWRCWWRWEGNRGGRRGGSVVGG